MNYLWEYKNKTKPNTIYQIIKILAENRNLSIESLIPENPQSLITQIIADSELKKISQLIIKHASGKVLIYGDYDVDGVCSTAIMSKALTRLGITHTTYIPDRRLDGYGLNQSRLETLITQNPNTRLLITVDNGVSAANAIASARTSGLDVAVIDHHHLPDVLPNFNVLIHSPKTSASVLAWCVANYLESDDTSLSLACLGMIADVVPLTGFNRSIAYHGLKMVNQNLQEQGLTSLIKVAGLSEKKINAGHISFQIAPRINASGRISNASQALELLLSQDEEVSCKIASSLNELNSRRQFLTQSALNQVDHEDINKFPLIISHSPDFDEGVIGLVAAKFVEKYYKPAIVLSVGPDISKASARSHNQINIIEFLKNASQLYLAIGGHPQAAGFSVKTEQLNALISDLRRASQLWSDKVINPIIRIDCLVSPDLINLKLLNSIDQLSPFGVGNPQPIFSISGFCQQVSRVGSEKQHLSGYISSVTGRFKFIAFNWDGDAPPKKKPIEIACQLVTNEWQGQVSIELGLKDWRAI